MGQIRVTLKNIKITYSEVLKMWEHSVIINNLGGSRTENNDLEVYMK